MNGNLSKLLKRYSRYSGVPYNICVRAFKKSTPEQKKQFIEELKDLRTKQLNRQLPLVKVAGRDFIVE